MPDMFLKELFVQDAKSILKTYSDKLKAMADVYGENESTSKLTACAELVIGSAYGFLSYDVPCVLSFSDTRDDEDESAQNMVRYQRTLKTSVVSSEALDVGLENVASTTSALELIFGLMDHLVDLIEKNDEAELQTVSKIIDKYLDQEARVPLETLLERYGIGAEALEKIRANAYRMGITAKVLEVFRKEKTRSYTAYDKEREQALQAEKAVQESESRREKRGVSLRRIALVLILGAGATAVYHGLSSNEVEQVAD